MKKFNFLMVGVVMIYIFFAVFAGFLFQNSVTVQNKEYRIALNRILAELEESKEFNESTVKTLMKKTKSLKSCSILSARKAKDADELSDFFDEAQGSDCEIRPVYQEIAGNAQKEFCGYIKVNYRKKTDNKKQFISMELVLFCFFICIMAVLLYVYFAVLRPFHRFMQMPYDLAKGHLKTELSVKTKGYFSDFVWGLNVLKDNLDSSRRKEQRLEKEKKMLLLSISHDIKTPLNAIKLYATTLKEDMVTEESEKKQTYQRILEKCEQIKKFVQEIVKSSREDILEIEVVKDEFYIKDLVKMIKKSYLEKAKHLHLNFQIGEYKNRLLKGDFHRSYEVCENIIENAIKYGDGREIVLSFYEEDYCQLIRIHNSGEVVSENEFHHLFDSFFRGKNVGGKEGSGLGLYICKEIMHKMGGEIFAERMEDGMDFIIVFPL